MPDANERESRSATLRGPSRGRAAAPGGGAGPAAGRPGAGGAGTGNGAGNGPGLQAPRAATRGRAGAGGGARERRGRAGAGGSMRKEEAGSGKTALLLISFLQNSTLITRLETRWVPAYRIVQAR